MPNVQLLLTAPERALLVHLLGSELRDVRAEMRDTDFNAEYQLDVQGEEALIGGLLAKLQAASATLYCPAT